ncbi:quaternary ammonium compound-resistance protein SugE [Weissella uvarum]|uniref:DMT family transporter n=1 Tax=Weissella uvarum TaxID=1479233 RepID=UPI00195FE7D8|nr:multidrug efflux SMR transporter [Weissella uvarum]MBM7617970.1 quaternary ammonium compound-resistance protein SugE [Weissella uvarum]MCM0596189.1 multidrug efflux SMR transporter [Weissella uvarum]
MAWFELIVAGLFEVTWATAMKLSDGFTKWPYVALTIVGMALSVFFLGIASKSLPLSTAYPVWTGIGAIGSIIAGVIIFGDRLSPITWVFVVMLLISLIGINITHSH